MKLKRILSTFLITLLACLTLTQPLLASNWLPVPVYREETATISSQNGQLTLPSAKAEGMTSLTFQGESQKWNLWDEQTESGYWDATTGQKMVGSNWKRYVNPIRVSPNTTYYANVTNPSSSSVLIFRDINGNVISYNTGTFVNNTFTTPNNCVDIVSYFNTSFSGTICINLSQPDTSINPHNGIYHPFGILSNDTTWSGFNIFDEQWEVGRYDASTGNKEYISTTGIRSKNFIACLPNKTYYVNVNLASGNALFVLKYDKTQNYLGYEAFANSNILNTPNNCYYLTFYTLNDTTYHNDICINLSQPDTSQALHNGVYQAWNGVNLSTIKLNGINGINDTYDAQTGTLTRRIGVVDLGSLEWTLLSNNVFYNRFTLFKLNSANMIGMSCAKYECIGISGNSAIINATDKRIIYKLNAGSGDNTLNIKDTAYSDATAFKNAMSGVYLYYELATPQTTTISAQQVHLASGTNILTEVSGSIANTNVTAIYTQGISSEVAGAYYANVGSGANFEELLNDVPQDANTATLNLSSNITTLNTTFAVPANVTINLNSHTIAGVTQPYKSFVTWVNQATQMPVSEFTAGNTYEAQYQAEQRNITYVIPSATGTTPNMTDYTLTASGTNYVATSTYGIGEGMTLPKPTMTGYAFDGWYINADYSGLSYTSVTNNFTTDITFYAKWRIAPNTIDINDVHVYRNLINENDRLITFMYNIDWGNNYPTSSLNDWFTFNLLSEDGTEILATCQPYPFWNYGYGYGVGSFYFGNGDVINWNGEYQIRIDGDSSKWTDTSSIVTIYNLQQINYSDSVGHEANKDLLTGQIISYAQQLELYSTDEVTNGLVYVDDNGNTILTTYGQIYFKNDIPNIAKMTNGIFNQGSESVIIDPSDTPTPASQTLIDKWETQYEGTWVQDSLEGLGDLLGMNWRTATSILLLVAWVVLASISQIRWGSTDAGMWCGGVLMGVGVTMGIMNWAIVGTALLLLTFYSVYIVFWRQG